MEPETYASIVNVAQLLGGFFDFVVAAVLIGLGVTLVRKADAAMGYAIAGIAGLRFLTVCCSRVVSASFDPIPWNDMNGAVPMGLALFSFLNPAITFALWLTVAFTLVRLVRRITP
jgi:hypothetical protein